MRGTVTSENCHDWETRACNDWDNNTATFEDHNWDTGACNDRDGDTLSSEDHYNSSNSGDQHDKDDNWDSPLHSNAEVSAAECILLVMGVVLSAKLTQESIQYLLALLLILLLSNQLLLSKSKYLFKTFLKKNFMELRMYCHKCFSLLEDDNTVCSICSRTINRKKLANRKLLYKYSN